MNLFRLCDHDEITRILYDKHFLGVGHKCEICPCNNTHKYLPDENYLHFFNQEIDLLYLSANKGKFICVYNIPHRVFEKTIGTGFYIDFINFTSTRQVSECAIESKKIKFKYLKKIYQIKSDLDFDYIPSIEEIYNNLDVVYSSN